MSHMARAFPVWVLGLALSAAHHAAASESQDSAGGDQPQMQVAAASGASGSASADSSLTEVVITAHRISEGLWRQNRQLDTARDENLLPKLGATEYHVDQQALQALPQGQNTPLDKLLLQTPAVSYDSAISNPDFHIRNEYANVQYRINGIQLPDGVSALGPVLETGFIGNLNLLDGALPAQYGLRTAGGRGYRHED